VPAVPAEARDVAHAPTADAPPAAKASAKDAAPERRLAKFLASMPAKDAARILEQMDNADIQTIIAHMADRQAAAVLGNLPPARAAAVGRATMGRPPAGRAVPAANPAH
jgi:flagellar motility protein MotE (MotC chaperone)